MSDERNNNLRKRAAAAEAQLGSTLARLSELRDRVQGVSAQIEPSQRFTQWIVDSMTAIVTGTES